MNKMKLSCLLNGYETVQGSADERFYCNSISGSPGMRPRSRTARRYDNFVSAISDLLSYSSTRMYGMFLVGFGLLSLLLHFTKEYVTDFQVPLYVLMLGTFISILGVVFLVFDKPLSTALQEFRLTDFIFYEFFCIKRMPKKDDAKTIPPFVGLALGMVLAIISIFVPFYYIALALLAIVYFVVTMVSTEFGYFATFLVMPYLGYFPRSDTALALLTLVTFLSFMRKVARGKRVYSFEQYDLVIAVFLAIVFVTGIVTGGSSSLGRSLFLAIMSSGYALSSSLITNRRLADCMMNSIIISSIPVTLIAIVQGGIRLLNGVFGGVSGTFSSSGDLAVFLIVSAIFTLYYIRVVKNVGLKLLYSAFLLFMIVALVFVGELWVLVTGLIAILAYLATKLERYSGVALVGICAIPSLLIFLPMTIITQISGLPVLSLLRLEEYAIRWQNSLSMLADNLFAGIGIGPNIFGESIKNYDVGASYTDSGSFFLGIGLEVGIIGLLAFLILFAIRIRHRSRYAGFLKRSEVRELSKFSAVALVALIVYGAFNFLWSDATETYLFWCVFGASSAGLRVSRQNYDDYVGYYSDGRSDDSSALDVELE